ncbi:polysaccharide biosynthesis/export family protein [Novosphingobium panipatense]
MSARNQGAYLFRGAHHALQKSCLGARSRSHARRHRRSHAPGRLRIAHQVDASSLGSSAGAYRVNAGDKLRIVIQDLAAANGEYTVEDSGMISLPYVKQIAVGGMTYREIEQSLATTLLRQGIMTGDPVVNVAPVQLRPFYIVGEVNKPGEFEFRQGMTVLSALSAAGGYTYRASTGAVSITRTVNGAPMTARADEHTPILPGDQIRVYERWF